MDIARNGFRVATRFFRDSDVIGTAVWSVARPGAKCFEGWSTVFNPNQENDPWNEPEVGPLSFQPYRPNKLTAPPGIDGQHVCGTPEDFSSGGLYLPDLPPPIYTADGYLACCAGAKVLRGGAGAGGRADYHVYAPLARRGGAGAGGRADYRVYPGPDSALGGVEVGGTAGDVWSSPGAAHGGVEIGGSAGDVLHLVDGTDGGVEIGGSAGDVWVSPDHARGGVEIGGAAGDVLHLVDGTDGGVEIGGAAGDVLHLVDGTDGGVEIGGSAGDVYTPPGPTPGATCGAAGVLILEEPAEADYAVLTEQWWRANLGDAFEYHCSIVSDDDALTVTWYYGGCDALNLYLVTTGTTCSPLGGLELDQPWYFRVVGAAEAHYSIEVGAGACP